jgi:hypothetical protein
LDWSKASSHATVPLNRAKRGEKEKERLEKKFLIGTAESTY